MKEGVPGMSIANAGGGSCEIFMASGVVIITPTYLNFSQLPRPASPSTPSFIKKGTVLTH